MWLILLLRILYWIIRICVPSPQSIKKLCSAFCTTWAVGCRLKAGIAELFPKMVMASIILNVRCQMYDVRCMISDLFYFLKVFNDATIIFNISFPSLYKIAILFLYIFIEFNNQF